MNVCWCSRCKVVRVDWTLAITPVDNLGRALCFKCSGLTPELKQQLVKTAK